MKYEKDIKYTMSIDELQANLTHLMDRGKELKCQLFLKNEHDQISVMLIPTTDDFSINYNNQFQMNPDDISPAH